MPLVCHILIGCPSCGKSTLAAEIVKYDSNYCIVSTDKIREKLFGDESIQGSWELIEAEVISKIEQHLKAGNLVIYDATNAERSWRISLLQKLAKFSEILWVGWYIKTPIDVCKSWNQKRKRKVPEEVIEKMSRSLTRFPPIEAEGFAKIILIKF